MEIRLLKDSSAQQFMADTTRREEWRALAMNCAWANSCQSHAFVGAWYGAYATRYQPLLVVGTEKASGQLRGVIALAVSRKTGKVVAAGAQQAEYQTWISSVEDADAFMIAAVRLLRPMLGRNGLRLRYIPPEAPSAWQADPTVAGVILRQTHRRPLMAFGDGVKVEQSLKKSGNKSRIRRLKNVGELELAHLTTRDELEKHLDSIIDHYDLRRMALNGIAPFHEDPFKRQFHLAMMDVPGTLHATALTIDGRMVSAHFSAVSRSDVSLGLLTHDAAVGRLSPGKVHMLLLAQRLCKEGMSRIDLTPGGDAYKERFATDWDEVNEVTIFPSAFAARMGRAKQAVAQRLIAIAAKRGISTSQVKSVLAGMSETPKSELVKRGVIAASRWIYSNRECRVYACDASKLNSFVDAPDIREGQIADVLKITDAKMLKRSRQAFVSESLHRVELGHRFYSKLDEEGRLVATGWVAVDPDAESLVLIAPALKSAEKAAVLYDVRLWQTARDGKDESRLDAFVGGILNDTVARDGDRLIMVAAFAGTMLDEIVRTNGAFEHEYFVQYSSRFGRDHFRILPEVAVTAAVNVAPPINVEPVADEQTGKAPAVDVAVALPTGWQRLMIAQREVEQ